MCFLPLIVLAMTCNSDSSADGSNSISGPSALDNGTINNCVNGDKAAWAISKVYLYTDVYCTDNSKKPQKIISPIFFGLSGALQLIIWEADEFELDFNEIETIDKVKASSLIIGSVFLSRELKKISHHNFSYYINPVKTNPTLNLSFKF